MTMTTAMTTPQINDLIGWLKENHGNRAVRAARFFWCNFLTQSVKRRREIFRI